MRTNDGKDEKQTNGCLKKHTRAELTREGADLADEGKRGEAEETR